MAERPVGRAYAAETLAVGNVLSRDEVWAVIKKLKEGKATGGDGIPNEV